MAAAHALVLADLGCDLIVAGRGEESASRFTRETGIEARTGGLDRVLGSLESVPDLGVVAVPVPDLAAVANALIDAGVGRVLVEKPGGLTRDDVDRVATRSRRFGTTILVAYNRRFYASVRHARRLIEEDGGVVSFSFEFTELSRRIEESSYTAALKSAWFFANSTHVVDLAFFLGGEAAEIDARVAGSLPWHSVARFVGSGKTTRGALFSYHADWSGPGRWGVELITERRRLVLRPLEELKVLDHGEWDVRPVDLGTDIDSRFKPGLHAQAQAFLENDDRDFIDIDGQLARYDRVYSKMVTGSS